VLEAAQKGGWRGYKGTGDNGVFLDALFWKSLGRSMKWEKWTDLPNPDWCSSLPLCDEDSGHDQQVSWLYQWRRLIDHLAGGGTLEGFFKDLT
jgi:hypothetical protein